MDYRAREYLKNFNKHMADAQDALQGLMEYEDEKKQNASYLIAAKILKRITNAQIMLLRFFNSFEEI